MRADLPSRAAFPAAHPAILLLPYTLSWPNPAALRADPRRAALGVPPDTQRRPRCQPTHAVADQDGGLAVMGTQVCRVLGNLPAVVIDIAEQRLQIKPFAAVAGVCQFRLEILPDGVVASIPVDEQ